MSEPTGESDIALGIDCPACGAPAGKPCNAPAEGAAAVEVCGDRADAAGYVARIAGTPGSYPLRRGDLPVAREYRKTATVLAVRLPFDAVIGTPEGEMRASAGDYLARARRRPRLADQARDVRGHLRAGLAGVRA